MTIAYAVAITLWLWRGSVFAPLRELRWGTRAAPDVLLARWWRALWSCPLCLGTWVGWCAFAAPPELVALMGRGALVGCAAFVLRRLFA